ncbi:30S ribosomal protein S2 [bacterium]|nr:MAG: 30S ribosomal protein S2 [bacterium]
MSINILNLYLRNHFRNIFLKKLRANKKNRLVRTRQVRKFSSNFLFQEKKNTFFSLINKELSANFNSKILKSKRLPLKVNFRQNRLVGPNLMNNNLNRRVAGRNARIFNKFKKVTRMKKTSRKFGGIRFYKKFPNELLRENPLNRFYTSNLQLLSFNYNYLLNFHTAIGNSSKSWINPSIFSKVLAIRNDMILYDLSFTFIALKKGLQSIFQVSKFKGSVLGYVSLDRNYKFSGVGFDHFLRSWLPGYLTNFKQVIKNILSLQTKNIFNLNRRQKKFLKNIDLKRKLPLNYYYYFWKKKFSRRSKFKKTGSFTKIPAIPSFGFSLEDYSIWVNECQKIGLRTMAVCDSESFPQKIDFPLIGNQQSLPLSFFLVKLVSETVSSGKRFDYFSFIGFQFISSAFKRTQKVDDRLLKKTSFNPYNK